MYRYAQGKLISCLQLNAVNGVNELFKIEVIGEDNKQVEYFTTYRNKFNDARSLEGKQVKIQYNVHNRKNWLNSVELAKDKL